MRDKILAELGIGVGQELTPTEEKELIKLVQAIPKGEGRPRYKIDRKTLNELRKHNNIKNASKD